MNSNWTEITGSILAVGGSIFLFLGSLGLVRMPDAYNRIQTGTKASTLGTILSLTGLLFLFPGWVGKFVILILFVLITNPISSHVLARAAYFTGVPLTRKTTVDQLSESLDADPSRKAHLKKVHTDTEEDKK